MFAESRRRTERNRMKFKFTIRALLVVTAVVALLLCALQYPSATPLILTVAVANLLGFVIAMFLNRVLKLPTDGGHWDPELRADSTNDDSNPNEDLSR